jgi:hypothetical protein
MPKIAFIKWDTGDWIQMYVNGEKVYEGHSIPRDELLRLAGVEFDSYEILGESDEAEMIGWSGKSLDEALVIVNDVLVCY